MIKPYLTHTPFLDDVKAALKQIDTPHLWWLGQSGFLVQWRGQHLLIDPYLSDSLTRKYATTDKPHIRMTELVVEPARLDFIDIVTSSHNHTDHLDGETLTPLRAANPDLQIVVPAANRDFAAERLRVEVQSLQVVDAGERLTIGDFHIHAVPAAHEELEQDEAGRHRFLGYVFQFGAWTLYHSGDTIWYTGLEDILRQWNINVAILPINGSKPERRVAGNLNGVEAARLAHQVRAGVVIPCHYDMFTFNTASPDAFVTECKRLGQKHKILQAGARYTLFIGDG